MLSIDAFSTIINAKWNILNQILIRVFFYKVLIRVIFGEKKVINGALKSEMRQLF